MKTLQEIPQVAILVGTTNNWGREVVRGILTYANEVGPWHIWIKPDVPGTLDAFPKGWRGDGVIARVVSRELADQLTKTGLPIIDVADVPLDGFSAPCVRADDRIATQMAADFFVARGFRNLAFVGPCHRPNPAWYAKAFQRATSEHGLPCRVFSAKDHEFDQDASLTAWLLSLPKPVGILTWGHDHGRIIVDCCMEAGISVPHDIAILSGSYDELLSHACFPALSGIQDPTVQIGYRAAEKLHACLLGKKVPNETLYLPPQGIQERLSTDTLAVEDPKLAKVVAFLRDHAFESITMKDILRAVPMARRSLERRFQQAFGRSPLDEVRRLRINRARKLLAETDLPMQDIAEACGFATYNYLTHVFKKQTGITPRDYRKRFSLQGSGSYAQPH